MGEDNRHEQREREQREQNRQDEKDRQEEQDRQTREICEKLEHEQQNRLVQQHLDKEQQLRNEQETEQRYREIVERNSHELLFHDPYEDEQPFLNLNIDMDSLISKISDQFIKKWILELQINLFHNTASRIIEIQYQQSYGNPKLIRIS